MRRKFTYVKGYGPVIGRVSSKWTEIRIKPERYGERGKYVFGYDTGSLAVIASVRILGPCARTQRRCALQDGAAKVRLAMAAMGQKETKVTDLCSELAIARQTLYRHLAPDGDAAQGQAEDS